MLFALHFEGQLQLAIYHSKLLSGGWMAEEEAGLVLMGTTLDAVWENWVRAIGDIHVEEGNTLTEQIALEERAKLQRQIETLEKRCRAERQPHRRLYEFRQTYLIYPQLGSVIAGYLVKNNNDGILRLPTAELQLGDCLNDGKLRLSTAKSSGVEWQTPADIIKVVSSTEIRQSAVPQIPENSVDASTE